MLYINLSPSTRDETDGGAVCAEIPRHATNNRDRPREKGEYGEDGCAKGETERAWVKEKLRIFILAKEKRNDRLSS